MHVLTENSIGQVSGGMIQQCSGGSFADAAIGGAIWGGLTGSFAPGVGTLAGGVGGFTAGLTVQVGVCLFYAIR